MDTISHLDKQFIIQAGPQLFNIGFVIAILNFLLYKPVKIITEAEREALQLIKRANIEIEREESKATDDIKTQIVEISTLLAGRYITTSADTNTQNRLLEEMIEDLGDAEWIN